MRHRCGVRDCVCDYSAHSDKKQRYSGGRNARFLCLPFGHTQTHTYTHALHLKPFTVQNVSSYLQHRCLSHTGRVCEASVCVCVWERQPEKLRNGNMQEGGASLKEDRGVHLDLM